MKLLSFVILIAISNLAWSTVDVNCSLSKLDGDVICEATFSLPIYYPLTEIGDVKCKPIDNCTSVTKFGNAVNSEIFYFPRGLRKLFPKLIKIQLNSVKLKKIHQVDLAPFERLQFLHIANNDLRYIEKDLFASNLELNEINLNFNQIQLIDPNVFDDLKLIYIGLLGDLKVQCINKEFNNHDGIANVRNVKNALETSKCSPSKKVLEKNTTQPPTIAPLNCDYSELTIKLNEINTNMQNSSVSPSCKNNPPQQQNQPQSASILTDQKALWILIAIFVLQVILIIMQCLTNKRGKFSAGKMSRKPSHYESVTKKSSKNASSTNNLTMHQTHNGKSTPVELPNYSTPINSHVDGTYNNPINSLQEDNDYEEIPGYKNIELVEYEEVSTMKIEDMEDRKGGNRSDYAVPIKKSDRQQSADFNA